MSKGYEIYINDELMPVAPPNITTERPSRNETIDLVNGGEFNLIRKPGLGEINIKLRLPSEEYMFAHAFKNQDHYLQLFEKLKSDQDARVFSIMILRTGVDSDLYNSYLEYATLEDYTIEESTGEGTDQIVNLTIKQFIPLKDQELKFREQEDGTVTAEVKNSPRGMQNVPDEIEALENDSALLIAQKYFGDESKASEIAKLNGLDNPNDIKTGQAIKLKNNKGGYIGESWVV